MFEDALYRTPTAIVGQWLNPLPSTTLCPRGTGTPATASNDGRRRRLRSVPAGSDSDGENAHSNLPEYARSLGLDHPNQR